MVNLAVLIGKRIGMECLSLRVAWAGGHLPQVAAPVVVGAGVLTAVDPDLVLEDYGDR